jgi:hypothetical protein
MAASSPSGAMTEPPRWWTVRRAQNLEPATYRCPFCHKLLPALSEHALVMPEGDARGRRHAHTACVITERKTGRLPARDEWQRAQPKRVGRLARLFRHE